MPSIRKRWLMNAGIALVLAIIAIGAFMLAVGDYWYAYSFERIELGATRAAVVGRLGEPAVTSQDCNVAQWIDYESPAHWLTQSQTVYCAHWLGPSVAARSPTVPGLASLHVRPEPAEHAGREQGVDEPGVGAEDIEAHRVGEEVVFREVQQKQVLHAVKREPLPELRGEADVQAPGVAQQFGLVREVFRSNGGGLSHVFPCVVR